MLSKEYTLNQLAMAIVIVGILLITIGIPAAAEAILNSPLHYDGI